MDDWYLSGLNFACQIEWAAAEQFGTGQCAHGTSRLLVSKMAVDCAARGFNFLPLCEHRLSKDKPLEVHLFRLLDVAPNNLLELIV
jgi:hypothetical protein